MASHNGGPFAIGQLPIVLSQVRTLAQKAMATGALRELRTAVVAMIEELRTRPLQWDDPESHPRKQGSLVCHGIVSPLFVRYVVYEPERVVIVLEIRPLPGSGLEL